MNRKIKPGGFVLVGVLLLSIVLVIITTTLVFWVQQESNISVKHRKSSVAFNLAEAAVDQGRWKLQERSDNWTIVESSALPGYDFDQTYEGTGGIYAIKISSDPSDSDRRIIEGVGRDSSTDEVRRIKAIFQTNDVDFSIQAKQTVGVAASCNVYWGPIMAGVDIDTDRLHPRLYSREHIIDRDGGSTSPQTDNVQWWSYFDLPPAPEPDVDFGGFYYSSAVASGAPPDADCGPSYYMTGDWLFKGCHDLTWKTYYITGDATFKNGAGDDGPENGNHIRGNVIILGDILFSGNGGTNNSPDGDYAATLPQKAWKEYGKAWGVYQGFDPGGAPGTYDAAVATNYTANATYNVEDILVHGFLYTGGSQGLQGGGNGRFHGVLMTGKDALLQSSNFSIYFDEAIAKNIKVANFVITRVSWYEVAHEWPAGL